MIRSAEIREREDWFRYDGHMSPELFEEKIRDRQPYVAVEDGKIIGNQQKSF